MACLVALGLLLRAALTLLPALATFVLVTALTGGVLEADRARVLLGVAVCLGLPLLLRRRVAAALGARGLKPPSLAVFFAAGNAACAAVLALGFADSTGRALRRHGEWFLGESHGAVARSLRAGLQGVAAYLERFDPPPELAPVVIPPDPQEIPLGPWRPGETPEAAKPVALAWFHPLAGPRRALPLTSARRFGATRPPPRPAECELGHCGVDLGTTPGEPVFAIFDGVVERVERDAARGGRAGRYVRIGHRDGTVVSRYIHLDTIRDGLREGDHVKGGELIGRLGRTGVERSGAHLHFGLSRREGGREIYVDPEPLLRVWRLPDPGASLVAAYTPR